MRQVINIDYFENSDIDLINQSGLFGLGFDNIFSNESGYFEN
jgi:hypothetical protein